MTGISTVPFSLHLLAAILMGATVGLERLWRQRMAGTRTNALVAAICREWWPSDGQTSYACSDPRAARGPFDCRQDRGSWQALSFRCFP